MERLRSRQQHYQRPTGRIAQALALDTDGVRNEWDPYDLKTPSGVRIEVKSAAYIQSWHQTRPSSVTFHTPQTRAWDPKTNLLAKDARRQADVYVFALLSHIDKKTIDPLNVNQWRFYVLPTMVLDARTRSQHSIALKTLQVLCAGGVDYRSLRQAVERAAPLSDQPSAEPLQPTEG